MDQDKLRELTELKARVEALENEIAQDAQAENWPPRHFYVTWHVTAGFVLGMIGATTSLLFNIVGSLLVGQDPMQLIRVYLTFPLGEQALIGLPRDRDGLALAIGCALYLGTGTILGVPFHLVLKRYFDNATFGTRFVVVSVLALAVWVVNIYGILSWLQPLLIGGDPGNWISNNEYLPWWVAAATHLVFGWTMLLVEPFGRFVPYQHPAEARVEAP